MENVSLVQENGKFIDDCELLSKMKKCDIGSLVEYRGHVVTLEDIKSQNNRTYLHISIRKLTPQAKKYNEKDGIQNGIV